MSGAFAPAEAVGAVTYAHGALASPVRLARENRDRWAAACGVIVCAASVVAATWAAPEDAAFGRALLQLVVVGLPLSVGLFALRTPACRRYGIALVTMGFAWSLTPL